MKRVFPYIVLLSSISLAATAGYYSIFGLSKLFSAQSTAVIIMASILEGSKLITASYLHRYWKKISTLIKVYLTTALVTLMLITSLGIYGFLVAAYQETAYQLETTEQEVAILDMKRDRVYTQINTIQAEQKTLNANISELTNGISNNVIQYTNDAGQVITTTSRSTREVLKEQLAESKARRDTLSKVESKLNDSIANIDMLILELQTNSELSAEIGPLKYVAKITGRDTDTVINWFILLLIFVFDPLAVMLLIGANKALENNNTIDKEEPVIKDDETYTEEHQTEDNVSEHDTDNNEKRKILRSE